jgi:oligoribonuclease NrnB/cAMP/cGMP phosphodiesterase (DHH superfamily)
VNILIYTDNDLDGAGSALVLKWYFETIANVVIEETGESTLISKLKSKNGALDTFDKVFICDLALTEDIIPEVDKKNFVIFDHHVDHSKLRNNYKHAKTIIKPYSSCSKLIYDTFLSKLSLTQQQIDLINFIDEYDSYKIKNAEALKLNAIFYLYNNPKVNKFIESFNHGIRDFNILEKNSINLFFKKFKEQLNNAEIYKGKIKDYSVVATFANYAVNEVAHSIIAKHNVDIGIVVNKETKTVSFRRSKTSEVDVSILARKFCNGGGSVGAAGGALTEQFGNLTKLLTRV